jgi:hypothetical protein
MQTNKAEEICRRQFVTKTIIAGTSCFLGCSYFLSKEAAAQEALQTKTFQERIGQNVGLSYEQVFKFVYRDIILPILVEFSHELGRDKLVEMIKEAVDKIFSRPEFLTQARSNLPAQFWTDSLDAQILEDTSDIRTMKVTKCLWAKIFREAKAEDFGYALACYPDYATAKTQYLSLERDKTLMQGHDCCLFKWTKNS